MYHFVAFLWDTEDLSARATVRRLSQSITCDPSWRCLVTLDGMLVYDREPRETALRAYLLPGDNGVVLGKLFRGRVDSDTSYSEAHVRERVAREWVSSGGERLTRDFWGTYVALLRNSRARTYHVLRDCSGRLPCYWHQHDSVTLVFSDIEDILGLPLPSFSLDKTYLAAFVHTDLINIKECGVTGVTELLAGDCLEVGRGNSTRQYAVWDPRAICMQDQLDNYELARAALKEVTQRCIDAWAAVYGKVVLRLSGGFDSAVVLGCLQRSPTLPDVACINNFTADMPDDERDYARLAATEAGVELHEQPRDTAACVFDERCLRLPRSAKPTIPFFFRAFDLQPTNNLVAKLGAEVVWTGQGGDHLFVTSHDALAAADYISQHGLGTGLRAVIADGARLSGQPYIHVLRNAWRLGRRRSLWVTDPALLDRAPDFVNQEALPPKILEYATNPWALGAQDVPKGKQFQIQQLADLLNRQRPIPNLEVAYELHPLISQPLMELSLRIPSYILLRGGRSRALARDAFRDRVPIPILQREDKGDAAAHVREAIRRSERFVQELLLDGLLVHEGIVKRSALEPYLVKRQSFKPAQMYSVVACIATELWARAWLDPKPQSSQHRHSVSATA